jgi:hypothetical protein
MLYGNLLIFFLPGLFTLLSLPHRSRDLIALDNSLLGLVVHKILSPHLFCGFSSREVYGASNCGASLASV